VHWRDLERAAPAITDLGRARLEQARVALLATLRGDGSPRVSPIEPYLHDGHLLFGSMSWSEKTRDLLRDPRCSLHSAITGPDSAEGELKLDGRAAEANDRLRTACSQGWWSAQPREAAVVFELDIERAVFISWDLEHAEMISMRWSSRRGYAEARRRYP
jgi:pyridoxamine 5'-phosphate oxidase-like protein